MNKQSSYRVVDVLTTDTCPVKLVPSLKMWKGNVLPSEVRHNLSPHVGVRHYAICVYAIYTYRILSYMLLVIFMYNHMAH